MGHPSALNSHCLWSSPQTNLSFQGPGHSSSHTAASSTLCHTLMAAYHGCLGPPHRVPLSSMFSFPAEWVTHHGEHPGPHAHTSTGAPPRGILGFDCMSSPHLGLYLINLTSPKPTMGLTGRMVCATHICRCVS